MRSISAKVWRSRWREPTGERRRASERSTRSRASAACSAAASAVCCSSLEALLDVRAQFVESLADGRAQRGRGGLEPILGDAREHAGLAAEPRVAQFLPARLHPPERRSRWSNRTRTSPNWRATPSASATPSSASVFVVGSSAMDHRRKALRLTPLLALSAPLWGPPPWPARRSERTRRHPSRPGRRAPCDRSRCPRP